MLDHIYGRYRAVSSGLRIGVLPQMMSPEAAGRIKVLPDFAPPKTNGYFVYPSALRQSKPVAGFRDFLLRKIAEMRLPDNPPNLPAAALVARSSLLAGGRSLVGMAS